MFLGQEILWKQMWEALHADTKFPGLSSESQDGGEFTRESGDIYARQETLKRSLLEVAASHEDTTSNASTSRVDASMPPAKRQLTKPSPASSIEGDKHGMSVGAIIGSALMRAGPAPRPVRPATLVLPRKITSSSVETCIKAASEISIIGQQFLLYSPMLTNSQFPFCLFTVGRMLSTHSKYHAIPITPALDTLIASLYKISARWAGPSDTLSPLEENLASAFAKCSHA
ncbi:hypothetical protein BDV06DRAFT_226062 [Aspergillus oleicola]